MPGFCFLLSISLFLSSDAVFLHHQVDIEALNDSEFRYIEITREKIVPLNGRGLERFTNLTINYRRTYEEVRVLLAQSRPWRSGRTVLDASVSDSPHSSLLEESRFESSLREITLTFPGLETGDTIYLEMERRIRRLPLDDLYSYTFFFESRDSIDNSSFTVRWPSGRELHWQSIDGSEPRILIENPGNGSEEVVIYQWEKGPASPVDIFPLNPQLWERLNRVVIAGNTPQEVSISIFSVFEPLMEQLICCEVVEIVEEIGSDPDKLRLWVAENIEILGVDAGEDPGYLPRSPEETLESRCGVCRDKALLLAAFLEEAGFETCLALVNSTHRLDSLVGSRSFNHLITLFIDPITGEMIPMDASLPDNISRTGYFLRGLDYLPIMAEGSSIMRFEDPEGLDTLSITCNTLLEASSDVLEGDVLINFSGASDELYRNILSSVASESIPEVLATLFGCDSMSELDVISTLHDLSDPLVVSGRLVIPIRSLEMERGKLAIMIPGLFQIDKVGSRLCYRLLTGGTSSREIVLDTPQNVFLNLVVELSRGISINRLPEDIFTANYTCTWRYDGISLHMYETSVFSPVRPDSQAISDMLTATLLRSVAANRIIILNTNDI